MFCILCGFEKFNELFSVKEVYHQLEEFTLVTCRECGMVQTSPRLGSSEIVKYYETPYCNREDKKFKSIFESIEVYFRTRRAHFIGKMFAKSGCILDVGCGRGKMLAILNKLGWEAHGCELNERRAFQARQNEELTIYTEEFEKINLPEGFFDAISLWHVLEHLLDPKAGLRKAGKILKKEGLLIIEVPNIESMQSKIFTKHWFHLDVPRHISHFSPKTLKSMLDECGFAVRSEQVASLEYGFFSFLQSLLDKIGFRRNLLYHMTMKSPDTSSLFLRKILMFLALPFLMAMSLIGAVIEVCVRRGDVVRVIAVKK